MFDPLLSVDPANAPPGASCGSCFYAVAGPYNLECRANPPVATLSALPPSQGQATAQLAAAWPAVNASHWCGIWKSNASGPLVILFLRMHAEGEIRAQTFDTLAAAENALELIKKVFPKVQGVIVPGSLKVTSNEPAKAAKSTVKASAKAPSESD